MTDRVDALVQAMQASSPQPAFDSPCSKSHPQQLPTGDDPVLPLGNLRDPPVYVISRRRSILAAVFRAAFSFYASENVDLVGHAADAAEEICT